MMLKLQYSDSKVCDQPRPLSTAQGTDNTVRVVLPFKDQNSAEFVKKQLKDLSLKVNKTIQPVFTSRKLEQELKVKEKSESESKRFEVLKKCKNKFDCLVYEMLFIRTLKPSLNVQTDSIRAKVFL